MPLPANRRGWRAANCSGSRLSTTVRATGPSRWLACARLSRSHLPTKPLPPVMKRRAPRSSFHSPSSRSTTRSRSLRTTSSARAATVLVKSEPQEVLDLSGGVRKHVLGETGVDADPERVVHDDVGVRELARDAELASRHGGLAREVAAEEQARADAILVQVGKEIDSIHVAAFPQRDRESEPRRFGARGGLGKDEELLAAAKALLQEAEVAAARGDEGLEPVHLRERTGRLHVGDLQVVADMRVGGFVVVTERQLAQLPAEALAAGVVLAGSAIAIAAPVAEGVDEGFQLGAVGEDGAAFAHGDVMGGIEAERADVAEGPDDTPVVGGAEAVAEVFHEPEIVALAQIRDRGEVERVAERVGQHDRLGARRDRGLDEVGLHV